jgi:hypothetical protein
MQKHGVGEESKNAICAMEKKKFKVVVIIGIMTR